MQYVIRDKLYGFYTLFDTRTGTYIRSNVPGDSGDDPFMASFPHLIDVGVMGHCTHGRMGLCTVGCYQRGETVQEENMSVEDFRWIVEQCAGRVHQFALGGRGDPDQHEEFETLLKMCRKCGVVPNFTTSGYGITPEIALLCRKYCGAVAVSWYRGSYTRDAIHVLLSAGVKTNIHYVLSRDSMDEAVERLRENDFPLGINAVVFLLYKPAGSGCSEQVLRPSDQRLRPFFSALMESHPFKIGIDSCMVSGLVNVTPDPPLSMMDACEGGRFSCYIGPDLTMTPCSFDQERYRVRLRPLTIEEAWSSLPFTSFRRRLQEACPDCTDRLTCMGGCPLMPEIVLCGREERSISHV